METKTRITVLNHILALNLDVNIWSARKKLTPYDFGATQLPPKNSPRLEAKEFAILKICASSELSNLVL